MYKFLTKTEFTTGAPVINIAYLFLMERPFSFHFLNLMLDHHETFRFPLFFVGTTGIRIRSFLSSACLLYTSDAADE